MKEYSWSETKEAANRCFWIMKPRLQGYDITTYVYDGNLPKLLTDIAVHAFLYEHTKFGHDLVIVKSGLYQLEDKGFIGKGE